jgi:hypothetical protein
MEYVYICEKTQDFQQAKINLMVGDDDADIYIKPQQMMTCGELNSILGYLKDDIIKKLRLDILKCHAFIIFDGITYDVEMADGTAVTIKELDLL